ncbi:MAG: hypothetical protein ACR2PZ_05275 [Pseudomonadales bacterium]
MSESSAGPATGDQQLGSLETERRFKFEYRERPFEVVVTAQGTLQLFLDGILRKDRPDSGKTPQYVWTNVELQWEEHHYVEVRYWNTDRRLLVTINRTPTHELRL